MAKGKHDAHPPAHEGHGANFDAAMTEALKDWRGTGDETLEVKLYVTVSPNPGGVKTYIVTLNPGQPSG